MKRIVYKLREEECQIKIISGIMLFFLLVTILPMLFIGLYSVKSIDDFPMFASAEACWNSSHSIVHLIANSAKEAYGFWKGWQGVWFQEFTKRTLSGLCGDNFYFVGSFVAIGSLTLGSFLLIWTTLRGLLNADKYRTIIVSTVCVTLQLLYIYSPVEGFYWFTGSVHYTGTFGVNMLLFALNVLVLSKERFSKAKLILLELVILILSFMVSGGTFVAGISTFTFYLFLCIYVWIARHPQKILITVHFVIYIPTFLLTVLAPGNFSRLVTAEETGYVGYSAVKSVIHAVLEAGKYLGTTPLPFVLVAILLIPIMWKMVDRKGLKYRLPALVTLLSFGVFASQFVPQLYTLGIIGMPRVLNLYRLTMILWLYGNELYWIGWVKINYFHDDETVRIKNSNKSCFILPFFVSGLIIIGYTTTFWGGHNLTSVSAIRALRNGEAQQFRAEYEARLEILKDDSIKDVELEPYTVKPYLLFMADISEDEEDWANTSLAYVFNKDRIRLKTE